MIHQPVWLVLGIHDSQISVNTIVGIWMSHTLFQKSNKLLIVTKLLKVLNKIFQVIWMNDNLQTTESSSLEFFSSNACEANSFPNFWNIGFLRSFICCNIIFEHYINLGKLLIISNSLEKNFCCLIKLIFKASFSYFE